MKTKTRTDRQTRLAGKLPLIAGCLAAFFFAAPILPAQEMPEMPKPVKEHEWLQKFVGEWDNEAEFTVEPGKPPVKSKGSETVRALGGFWIISEGSGEMMGAPFSHVLTLGYDVEKKKYVGTWVDSMTGVMWKYEGAVNEAGTALTLETTGPCPMQPGKIFNFKEVLELKDKDHKVFTSSMQGEDGKWTTMGTVTSRRK